MILIHMIKQYHFRFLFLPCDYFESNWSSLTYAYHVTAYVLRFRKEFLNYFLQNRFNRMRDLVTESTRQTQKSNLHFSPRHYKRIKNNFRKTWI